jgi:hypothetical protein
VAPATQVSRIFVHVRRQRMSAVRTLCCRKFFFAFCLFRSEKGCRIFQRVRRVTHDFEAVRKRVPERCVYRDAPWKSLSVIAEEAITTIRLIYLRESSRDALASFSSI